MQAGFRKEGGDVSSREYAFVFFRLHRPAYGSGE
jgi:hypothetical protein